MESFLRTGDPYDRFISVVSSSLTGWNYIHVDPLPAWEKGHMVQAGDVLGYVAEGAPAHVHLDRTTGLPDPTDPEVLRPVDDPLFQLQPNNETIQPTVTNPLYYRIATHDRFGTLTFPNGMPAGPNDMFVVETHRTDNQYFYRITAYRFDRFTGGTATIVGAIAGTKDQPGFIFGVGSPEIDIIAGMYDLFIGPPGIGVKTVMFSITGHKWGGQTGLVTSFHFGGAFIGDGSAAEHNYRTLRTFSNVRAVYSNDAVCNSHPDAAAFYTVTNRDADRNVEATDITRFWKSDVQKGNQWNDTDKPSAPNNAGCEFQDDFYVIRVTGLDNAGNQNSRERWSSSTIGSRRSLPARTCTNPTKWWLRASARSTPRIKCSHCTS